MSWQGINKLWATTGVGSMAQLMEHTRSIMRYTVAQVPYLLGQDALDAEQRLHNHAVDVANISTNLDWYYNPISLRIDEFFVHLTSFTIWRRVEYSGIMYLAGVRKALSELQTPICISSLWETLCLRLSVLMCGHM